MPLLTVNTLEPRELFAPSMMILFLISGIRDLTKRFAGIVYAITKYGIGYDTGSMSFHMDEGCSNVLAPNPFSKKL